MAAGMDWCRLWHDAPDDPKWRLIARRAGVRAGDVWAVATRMMVTASRNVTNRGAIVGWDDEVEAIGLDFEPDDVARIREAMQGVFLDGDMLRGWEKRQPKREDSTAADRKRKQRDRGRTLRDDAGQTDTSQDVTQSHARGEERRDSEPNGSGASAVIDLFDDEEALKKAVYDLANKIGRRSSPTELMKLGMSWAEIFAALTTARTKTDPSSYIAALIRNRSSPGNKPAVTPLGVGG